MSNMKNANRYVVAHGPVIPEVLEFVCKDFGRLLLDTEDIEDMVTTEYVIGDNKYYVAGHAVDEVAISCLDDHIANIPEEDLRDNIVSDDYMCANPEHVQTNIECYCSLDTCYCVRVYEHTYYGQGCIITCYYTVLADY